MKFLLDTVAISEFRKGSHAAPAVLRWQASLPDDMFGLSVVSLAEIRYGIRRVERKDPPFAKRLQVWYDLILIQREMFHVFPVDRAVAEQAADLRAAVGCPYHDAYIAATAQVHGLILATRNTSDFKDCGIEMVNPWEK